MHNSRQLMLMVFAIVIAHCGAQKASAQVKISMPPPPPAMRAVDEAPPATVQTAGMPATAAAAIPAAMLVQSSPKEGDIALARYAQARTGTYDTYFADGTFWNNGIRYVSYPNYIPQFVWGPFWGGWGGVWPGWSWGGCW